MQKYTTYDDLHATGPDGAYCGLLADERDVYLASEVDARIAEHTKDWEDAAKERVQHLARIAELEKALREILGVATVTSNQKTCEIPREVLGRAHNALMVSERT